MSNPSHENHDSIKLIHLEIPSNPITAEVTISKDHFYCCFFSDIAFSHFQIFPNGRSLEVYLGDILLWKYTIEKYILINTIKKKKTDTVYIIEGDLFYFNESFL